MMMKAAFIIFELLTIILFSVCIVHAVVFAIPLTFHIFFTVFGFWGGFYAQIPILAVIGISMFALGIGVHLWPWWKKSIHKRIRNVKL